MKRRFSEETKARAIMAGFLVAALAAVVLAGPR